MTKISKRPTPDRRQSQRHSTDLKVTMLSETNFYMGLSENMSEGGLFVATHQIQPIGTIVDLKFKLPMVEEPLEVKGEVRWVRPFSEDIDAHPGMGVRFLNLSDKQVQQIKAFLKTRPPIYYED